MALLIQMPLLMVAGFMLGLGFQLARKVVDKLVK